MAPHVPSEEEKEQFMFRAIELSEEGAAKRLGGPYGSVIVKDGKIVGQCFEVFYLMHLPSMLCKGLHSPRSVLRVVG